MVSEKEILWQELEKLDLTDYNNKSVAKSPIVFNNQFNNRTGKYSIFNQNLIRALVLYDMIGNYKVEEGLINISALFLIEMILLNLITSLEVYLKDTFLTISPLITVENINDKKAFILFLKEFNMKDRYFKRFSENNGNDYPLSKLIPKRIDFQRKEKMEIAFKVISIDLKHLEIEDYWVNIFVKERGYLKKRHKIVHTGFIETINSRNDLDINFINKATIDICKLVYEIDKIVVSKYPKDKCPDLYFQEAV
jgi:hypothetical protein